MAEMSRYVARLSLKCLARPSMASIASLERGFHGRAPVDHSNVPSFSSLVAKRSAGVFSMGAASSLGGVVSRPMSGGTSQARKDALNSITDVDRLIRLVVEHGHNFNRHDVVGVYKKFAELLRKRSGSPQGLSVAMENLKPQLLRSLRQMEHGPISVVMRSLGDLDLMDAEICAGLSQRLKELQSGPDTFRPPQIVSILWGLAKFRKHFKEDEQLIAWLCDSAVPHVPEMAAAQIGSLLWSTGMMRVDHPPLKTALQASVLGNLEMYSVFNVTQAISSLARLPGPSDPALLSALQKHVIEHHDQKPHSFRPKVVSGLFWGLASMSAVPEPGLVPRLTKLVSEDRDGSMNPFISASIMWSLVRWEQERYADPAMLTSFVAPMSRPQVEWSSQSCANMLWACARGFIPQDHALLKVVLAKALEKTPTLNSIETTQCLYALVFADWECPELTAALYARCKSQVETFEAGVSASALVATAMRQHRRPGSEDQSVVEPLLARIEAKIDSVGIREAQATLFAMAKLNTGSDALFNRVLATLPAALPSATKEVLCSLLWSLAYRTASGTSGPLQGSSAIVAEILRNLAQVADTCSESEKKNCVWALQVLGTEDAPAEAVQALTAHGLIAPGAGAGGGEDAKRQGTAHAEVGSAFPVQGERGWRVA
mmetsp:Transcript_42251/g.99171  ORF Transcript_42251/g.99171 Transcript_42251/m.99171 type:complete len:658 (-) Transcript_42251:106-2079(-)